MTWLNKLVVFQLSNVTITDRAQRSAAHSFRPVHVMLSDDTARDDIKRNVCSRWRVLCRYSDECPMIFSSRILMLHASVYCGCPAS